jgi:hypothetical protein
VCYCQTAYRVGGANKAPHQRIVYKNAKLVKYNDHLANNKDAQLTRALCLLNGSAKIAFYSLK